MKCTKCGGGASKQGLCLYSFVNSPIAPGSQRLVKLSQVSPPCHPEALKAHLRRKNLELSALDTLPAAPKRHGCPSVFLQCHLELALKCSFWIQEFCVPFYDCSWLFVKEMTRCSKSWDPQPHIRTGSLVTEQALALENGSFSGLLIWSKGSHGASLPGGIWASICRWPLYRIKQTLSLRPSY